MRNLIFFGFFFVLNSCRVAQDVSHVGGGYIEKSLLGGEWYYGATIVDKQYSNASSFVGAACGNDRIRFELDKDMLRAYRSYEKIPGTESGRPGYQSLIAAFKVLTHFDIKREYNTITGVENNSIIENDFDLPWNKRRYVRIDWSKNLVSDAGCNDWFKVQAFTQIQHETQAREPYRVRTYPDYIETTQEALIKPDESACEATGEWNCVASRVKMKLAFRKIKSNDYVPKIYPDYVPMEYGRRGKEICFNGEKDCEDLQDLWTYSGPDGTEICDPGRHNIDECKQYKIPVFSKFGFFRTDRYYFDREQGFTLTGRKQLINRWNLSKPIIYYLNVQFPPELMQAAQEIADDWNKAFSPFGSKVFQIKPNSCSFENVRKFVSEFHLEKELAENDLKELTLSNLEEACAVLEWVSKQKNLEKHFVWEQLGDIRYSILNYSPKAELAGPLGYGPSLADPLTGEIIHGAANIYGASLDVYASMGADMVQLINQKISSQDITKDDDRAKSIQIARSFEGLLKKRTNQLSDDLYFVKLPEVDVNNWNLFRRLNVEQRYLLKELRPSEWVDRISPLERKVDFWSQRNACYLTDMMDPQVADLAEQLAGKSWLEAYQIIRASIFKAVAAHELGHTFGLRHNFSASHDAMNFFPDFWKEAKKRRSEMQYASIMDYHQRFNSDFSGIGLYDEAAIQFGYGDLVEVFDESEESFVPKTWHNNVNLFHYKDLPYLYSGEGLDGKLKTHYQEVKNAYERDKTAKINIRSLPGVTAKPGNLYRRKKVSFDEYYQNTARRLFGKKGQKDLFEVPYAYCSDVYASGGGLTCNRWDMGASVEEIVDNAAELYNSYYWFNSFRRDKINITPEAYMQRLYARTYQPMLNPFKYLYHYQRTSLSIWPLVQDWSIAAYKGLNFFGKILQSVEPGRYCLTAENWYLPESETKACENPIEIDLDQGKYYNTRYTENFFYKANNIGHMYDKLLAMQALTDSKAYFLRDFSDQFNRGAFSIGYYRVFSPEMINLFTGLMLDKKETLAPYVEIQDNKPKIQYRNLVSTDSSAQTVELPKIKSSSSWIMRYYALLLPVFNFSSPVDGQLDYIKRARVTLVGSQHDPVIHSSDTKQIIFEDPSSKIQYRSVMFESKERSPGYLILEDAKRYTVESKGQNKDKGISERMHLIELLRMLGDAFELGR